MCGKSESVRVRKKHGLALYRVYDLLREKSDDQLVNG
jgi:hypothetical protein